jgi:peptidoglycan hydrolase-like protein with peptidoglycan-binding domain/3D (Asp-Asp-Asp) domain-containing protein
LAQISHQTKIKTNNHMLHTKTNISGISKSFNLVSFTAGFMAVLVFLFPLRVSAQASVVANEQASAKTDVGAVSNSSTSTVFGTPAVSPVKPVETSAEDSDATVKAFPYKQTFLISAYYSPIPNQNKYVTGSYSGDVRLNGDGVKAADGTVVYPGMVAAPKTYPFGTKMLISGIGTVAVHDRGGAIVLSGERGNSHDRLDVWMGYGDAGLTRALKWGKRSVEVTVYGIDDSIVEKVDLAGYSNNEKNANTHIISFDPPSASDSSSSNHVQITASTDAQTVNLASTVAFGSSSADIAKVQTTLKRMNYYHGDITSVYDQATRDAVTQFQVAERIVASENDFGAGYLGPKTMKVLADKLDVPTANAASVKVDVMQTFTQDLKLGDSGDDVRLLQQELKNIHLLGIDPSGFYGDVTQHAVYKFQQINQLVIDESSDGAGILGPSTRAILNSMVAERTQTEQLIAARKDDENP